MTPVLFRVRAEQRGAVEMCGPIRGPFHYAPASGGGGSASDLAALGIVCGGTGLMPMVFIMHEVLADPHGPPVSLVYCNTAEEDILLRSELEGMAHVMGGRLSIYLTLSRPPPNWTMGVSRVNRAMLESTLAPPAADAGVSRVLLCGPPSFLDAVAGPAEESSNSDGHEHAGAKGRPRRSGGMLQ